MQTGADVFHLLMHRGLRCLSRAHRRTGVLADGERECFVCACAVLHVPPWRRKSAREVLRVALYTLGLTSSIAGTPASRSQPLLADSGALLADSL